MQLRHLFGGAIEKRTSAFEYFPAKKVNFEQALESMYSMSKKLPLSLTRCCQLSGLGEVSWGKNLTKGSFMFLTNPWANFTSLCYQGLCEDQEKSLNHTEVEKVNFSSKQCLKCFGLQEGNKVLYYLWKGCIVLSFFCSSLLDEFQAFSLTNVMMSN